MRWPAAYVARAVLIAGVILAQPVHALCTQEIPQGYTASIHGTQLYYEIHGHGLPLVLLHGFGQTGRTWHPYLDALREHFRVIIPDLRGHGRSTNPSDEFTHRQAAQDVFALLDHLDVESFRAMGISTGGMTLIHMATQQPDRVERMVLIGATSYFPEQARAIMRRVSADSLTPEQWARNRERHVHGDDQIRALFTQFNGFKDSYDDMNFTPAYLSTITAHTLIVHGDRDRFFPVSIPTEMYRSVPNGYLWIVPNGGHVPISPDGPFIELALLFLRGAWEN